MLVSLSKRKFCIRAHDVGTLFGVTVQNRRVIIKKDEVRNETMNYYLEETLFKANSRNENTKSATGSYIPIIIIRVVL
jgi:hypothetical protein